MIGRCGACQAPVMFARTTSGLTIAVNALERAGWTAPAADGTGNLEPTGSRHPIGDGMTVIVVKSVKAGSRRQLLRRHRDTCPVARPVRARARA
jgi:hypothetical protein